MKNKNIPFTLTNLTPQSINLTNSDYQLINSNNHRIPIKNTQKQPCKSTFKTNVFDLIAPILVHNKNKHYHLIDGKKRLQTAIDQNRVEIPAIVLSETTSNIEAFKLMHCYQYTTITATPITTMSFIQHLQQHQISNDDIITYFLPNLNCEPTNNTLLLAKKINQLPHSIRQLCDQKSLSLKQCRRLTTISTDILNQSASWAIQYQLSASLFLETVDTLQDVTYNTNQSLTELLKSSPFRPQSNTNPTESLKNWLRQLKNPTITEINTTIQNTIQNCDLPENIKINWDKSCEEKQTEITLTITSPDQLKTLNTALQSDTVNQSIHKILDLI